MANVMGVRESSTAPQTRSPTSTGSTTVTRTPVSRLSEASGASSGSARRRRRTLWGSPRRARWTSCRAHSVVPRPMALLATTTPWASNTRMPASVERRTWASSGESRRPASRARGSAGMAESGGSSAAGSASSEARSDGRMGCRFESAGEAKGQDESRVRP
ncbi:hypothetical protein ACN28I_06595 [Archangium gephyra]|uniref:hypothetical protein n=1 Tax=Archangium gephyra TaxID=48 RepID=UPI003B820F2F